MNLLLDIGNTRIKWALQNPGAGQADFVASGDVLRGGVSDDSIERLCVAIGDVLSSAKQASGADLIGVTMANVGGHAYGDAMAAALKQYFGLLPGVLKSESQAFGLRNGYSDASQLGVDRWVAMIAAAHPDGRDYCVVDAGTAVTIDYVDGELAHQGGLIFPGFELMRSALFAGTGDIKDFAAKTVGHDTGLLLGRTTADAVTSGAVQATVGAVQRILYSGSGNCRLIVTGGDAQRLLPLLSEYEPDYRPLLVLEGVSRLAAAA
jgi:type III pantothenate kinase